jgi:hypothetical protein
MIRAKDVETDEDWPYATLCWASRANPNPNLLKHLVDKPRILDYLEEAIREKRERDGLPT